MLGIMMAVMIFITVVVFIEPIKLEVTQARTDLTCTAGNLTVGEEMTCIVTDSYLPLFIGVGLSVALAAVGIKKLESQ